MPGLAVPGVGPEYLQKIEKEGKSKKYTCLVFAWNLSEELRAKIRLLLPPNSDIVTFFPIVTKETIS